VEEFQPLLVSRRCQGVAALDVGKRIKQSEPLTVKQLELLHQKLESSERHAVVALMRVQDGRTLSGANV